MSNGKILYIDQTVIDNADQETIRFYPLKESEAIMLLSQVEYFRWSKRWKNLTYTQQDLEQITGSIADNLMNPIDDGEYIVTTPTELCEAVECGIINVFSRAVAGTAGNTGTQIAIDEEGNPILVDGGLSTGAGQSTNQLLSLMGQAEFIEERLVEYLQDWEDFYLLYPASSIAVASAMKKKYKLVPDTADGMASQYETFRASNPAPPTSLNGLDREIYCLTEDLTTIAGFILDDGLAEPLFRIGLIEIIEQEQYALWRLQSAQISDDYVNTPCYRFPSFGGVVNVSDWIDTGNDASSARFVGLIPPNRDWKVTLSGLYTKDANNAWDGMYRKINGTWSYAPLRLQVNTFTQIITPKTQPLRSETGYTVIYENATGQSLGININDITLYTGSWNMSFEDAGTNV